MPRYLLLIMAVMLSASASSKAVLAAPAAVVISGAITEGGKGGTERFVTNLADDGPGSLRFALEMPGPTIVKFKVGGVIRLAKPLKIREDHVTVAGETAPSPGITVWGAPLRIRANDVIVRHLRVRVGAEPGSTPDDRDGITILGDKNGNKASSNVLIENCSISWAIDETVSLWFPGISGVTIRNSIIAEGLNNSLHSKGPHSMGLLVGSGAKNVLIQGNLLAHNDFRNPVLTSGATALVLNNLIYNPGHQALHFYNNGEEPTLVSAMGNVVRKGPSSNTVMDLFYKNGPAPRSRIHMTDNDGGGTTAFDLRWPKDVEPTFDPFTDKPPVVPGRGITVAPAAATMDQVLKSVGARPWDRDATDKRIIAEVRARSGKLRDEVPAGEIPPAK